ncbi:MAG: SufS family cysteine desulfurase [Alphaproteobacteria bacterium]|nr:SufS family cysteine desulfurase [Alphaproteobacteria bacterium]
MYNVAEIRKDFPIFEVKINGKDNTFLDSGASAQKPKRVIDKMMQVYKSEYANVHRGSYYLSEEITGAYENARAIAQKFVNAKRADEIVFTRNATEAINLTAFCFGRKFLTKMDEVIISQAEHHANLVPWQVLRDEIGFELKICKIKDDGSFDWDDFCAKLNGKTKLVAITGMSNVLGVMFPIKEIITAAHQIGAKVLIDACQYAVHQKVDVQALDCDFLAFSGHKTYGPTGIGVLYGKYDLLAAMPPYQYGGDMVDVVTYTNATFDVPPARFEAGTPAIVQAIGLGEALEYMMHIGMNNIAAYEEEVSRYAYDELRKVDGLRLLGDTDKCRGGIFSFVLDGVHPQDLAFILDKEGIAVRVGHHCAAPLVRRMGFESVVRASLGMYNTTRDVDILCAALNKAKTFF